MKLAATIRRLHRALVPRLAALALLAAGAATAGSSQPWEQRLAGSTVALLGEVHDNADGQRMRLAALERAIARGWRPAIAMEQFDTDRQPAIDRARAERPHDAGFLIDEAGGPGWDWPLYRPLVQLALDRELPLIAANLPRSVTARLVRADSGAVLGEIRARELGLDRPLPAPWQAAQLREIDLGHCGALPASMLPGMVRAQSARDAVIAELLARHRADGVVLIAGNGHVRRDIGVPRWLETQQQVPAGEILAVGYLESVEGAALPFDAAVEIPPRHDRADPCRQFEQQPRPAPAPAASESDRR